MTLPFAIAINLVTLMLGGVVNYGHYIFDVCIPMATTYG